MSENTIKSLANHTEITDIQQAIEFYTEKIEHEKINLRLAIERLDKVHKTLSELQNAGKDAPPKKLSHRAKPMKKELNQNFSKEQLIENPYLMNKELNKNETVLAKIINEYNSFCLENKEFRKEIEDLRKDKLKIVALIENMKNENEILDQRFTALHESNKEMELSDTGDKIRKLQMLRMIEEQGLDEKERFEKERDNLEEKFHKIIEENIKRERDQLKEAFRKRAFRDVRKGEDAKAKKLLEEEEISDRTPILDALIEKWKYFTKYKKQMLDKYTRNANTIREAFDKMMKYLGIENFLELPIVLEKMEDQMSSIEIYISNLTNTLDILEETKRLTEFKINAFKNKFDQTSLRKSTFMETKKSRIDKIKSQITELKEDIDKKRTFFVNLQPETDDFLHFLENTYVSEYIPSKAAINKEVPYNELNVIDFIANVEDYNNLYEEIEKGVNLVETKEININRDIEKLNNEMKTKIDLMKKENYINNNFYHSMKNESKMNSSFDDTMRKMAEDIVNMVNLQKIDKESSSKKKK